MRMRRTRLRERLRNGNYIDTKGQISDYGITVGSVKKQVTLRVDADMLEWFKPVLSDVEGAKQGGKRGYQTAINAALRRVVEDEVKQAG